MAEEQPSGFRSWVRRYFTYRTPAAMICDGVVLLVVHVFLKYVTLIVQKATSEKFPRDDLTGVEAAVNPTYILAYIAEAVYAIAIVVAAAGVLFEVARRVGHARAPAEPGAPGGDGTVMP
jgi:hypothetical protein